MKHAYFVIALLLAGCAQISILTGGADDEYAPSIDSAKTFPSNGQTNFAGDRVHLKFNEYITLVKPNDNIIITPRPTVAPTFTAHNKTLEIVFNEPLQENTTYTINFNRAVADITERNDSIFQYVFSTGNYIDSLAVSGNVTDAFTNRPAADFLVALYPLQNDVQFDSVPYKLKPTYIAQTGSGGNFRLNYLKYGVYHLFVLDDKNKNLLLDGDEDFAFLPERTVLVSSDTIRVSMKSFARSSGEAKIVRTSFSAPAKLEVIFNTPPDSFAISTSCALLQEDSGKPDSLVYWLAENPTPKMRFAVDVSGELDTLRPVFKNSPFPVRLLTAESNTVNGKLLPDQQLELKFSEPINADGIRAEGIHIMYADSTVVPAQFEIKNQRTLVILGKAETAQTLIVDSAAVTSIYGVTLASKQTLMYENHPQSYYGSLVVNTDSAFVKPVLVYLLNDKQQVVDTIDYAPRMIFEKLAPGDYQLRLVIDENNDGSWTTGSLPEGRIPEKVIYFNETIQVKSKWEREVDWLLKAASN